ncbi:phosphatidylinositol 4-phosphate 5-kinase [Trifolium repens]|nr:phosphatidylinositol 4-phosphate 5-kinase [Trifolium repens]
MELSAFPTFKPLSNSLPYQFPCRCSLSLRHCDYAFRRNRNSKPFLQIRMCTEKVPSNGYGGIDVGETKSDFVEVIAIGGRKDAVLDFCLNSPFQLSSLRFWNVIVKDSQEVQLQQRSTKEEPYPGIVEPPVFMKSCSKTIVLVASAGYGPDHTVVVDIFETVRSTNGLTVAVVLKPFSFEGIRRIDEIKALMGKLKENTNLLIEIDIDALLKKDLLTLDEAMKTANDAVLLAIKAISVLKSEMHKKFIDTLNSSMKETCNSEIIKILECYKEARIGFGAAYNIKTSILQSIFDCPFLGVSLKDPNSVVICIVACSEPINDSDVAVFLRTFRETTEYTRDIIISTVIEPDVEPNLLITTVLTLGSLTAQQPSQNGGILSKLALHFPRVFSFWGRQSQQQIVSGKEDAVSSHEMIRSYDSDEGENRITPSIVDQRFDKDYTQLEPDVSNNSSKLSASRDSEINEDLFDTIANCPIPYESINEEGDSAFQREQLGKWNLGPGFEVAKEWAQEREADATPMVDNLSIFHLPVGVRPSEELKDCKHGVLSVRAASMLEAERDLSTKWSPVVEIQYRGGRYKGRCQGGLPEGKGRLVLQDGNIYDGLWHSGKKSGPGTFYFKNGDMFQGSWRDDVMHGKGWFYFHTGDRWFANFWKGKANGEGRFYTKSGDAFFGNFKDGWRHGQFFCVNANGTRYTETWEHGVLLDSKCLESIDD